MIIFSNITTLIKKSKQIMKILNLFQIRHVSMYQKLPNDPYLILNIERSADLKDVKKQYFKLAKKYHPDLNPGNDFAKKMFIVVKEAYRTIEMEKDPKLKQLREKSEKMYEKTQPEKPFKSRRPHNFNQFAEENINKAEENKRSKWLKQFTMKSYKSEYMPVHYKNIDRHGLK